MDKYIKESELFKRILNVDFKHDYDGCIKFCQSIPAADVAEVVRCRECKYYIEREDGYICANDYLYKDSEWFCADGEKE